MAGEGDGAFFAVVAGAEDVAEGGVAGCAGVAVGEEGDALVGAGGVLGCCGIMMSVGEVGWKECCLR